VSKRFAGAGLLAAALLTGWVGLAAAQAVTVGFWRATLQVDGEHLVVKEAFQFDNPGPALDAPLIFHLPHEIHGEVSVTVRGDESRSEHVARPDPADAARRTVDVALPSGRSSVTLSYNMHYEDPQVFTARFDWPVQNLQLFVQPPTIEVSGGGAERQPTSVMPGFATWTLPPLSQPGALELTLGGLSPVAQAPAPAVNRTPQQEERFRVDVRDNRFSQGGTRILVIVGLVVLLGLGLIYGLGSGEKITLAQAARLRQRGELYRLEDRFVSGQIDRETFVAQRDRLLQQQDRKTGKASKRQPAGKA